ncbi:MAG: hypothetical protein VCD33_12815 [Alphaproteobacteria bacterium]
MVHRAVILLRFLMLMATYGAVAGGTTPATVGLEIDSAYAANGIYGEHGLVRGWFPVDRVFLPFKPLVRGFLDHAGARLVRGHDAQSMLHVEILGTAQGMLYDFSENWQRLRRFRFIGARVQGHVILSSAGRGACQALFAGAIEARSGIPIIIGRDYRENPNLAPFDKALAEPGSFVAALAAVIGAVYGRAALLSAAEDDDPTIANHAVVALGPDPVAVECNGDWNSQP